jgi:ParB-like chromosome segregation protein Spo0J
MKHQLEQVDIRTLIPYVNNSRTHSDEQVTQIASSIKTFGFNNPILVDDTYGVIAGHGRLLAAQKLGLDTVPVLVLGHLSEAQKKAYILADNRIALNSAWDVELLKLELEDLKNDFDFQIMGFNKQELDTLFGDFEPEPIEEIDEINESVNFIIKCENIAQKEIIKSKLGITSEKITFDTFMAILDA